ncbi:MAG: hypothetical protein ACXACI_02945 [Candidatus Hodarchaeales archaeon]
MAEARNRFDSWADREKRSTLTCPWCNNETKTHTISGTVRFTCENCKCDGFITRLPKGITIQDFQSRKTIA